MDTKAGVWQGLITTDIRLVFALFADAIGYHPCKNNGHRDKAGSQLEVILEPLSVPKKNLNEMLIGSNRPV